MARRQSSKPPLQENAAENSAMSHHRRMDTNGSLVTLDSFDGSSQSRSSVPNHLVMRVSSASTARRPPRSYNLSSLLTLTDPKVLRMHQLSLRALANTVKSLSAYLRDDSRKHWESANEHFRRAVRTAAHVAMWASHYEPILPEGQVCCTDPLISGGEAVVPGWYSWWAMARTHEVRSVRRRLLAEQGLQRARFLHKRQTAMLKSMWTEVETISIASTRAIQKRAMKASRDRSADEWSASSPGSSRDRLSGI